MWRSLVICGCTDWRALGFSRQCSCHKLCIPGYLSLLILCNYWTKYALIEECWVMFIFTSVFIIMTLLFHLLNTYTWLKAHPKVYHALIEGEGGKHDIWHNIRGWGYVIILCGVRSSVIMKEAADLNYYHWSTLIITYNATSFLGAWGGGAATQKETFLLDGWNTLDNASVMNVVLCNSLT